MDLLQVSLSRAGLPFYPKPGCLSLSCCSRLLQLDLSRLAASLRLCVGLSGITPTRHLAVRQRQAMTPLPTCLRHNPYHTYTHAAPHSDNTHIL